MQVQPATTNHFFRHACCFEAALTPLALGLGWLTNTNPIIDLRWTEAALTNGILATLPMVLLFFALQALPVNALQTIRRLLLETLGSRLHQRHWADLLVLAAIAGFSEELLFRGSLQPWLERLFEPTGGLIVSNLVFALAHAVTPLYAVMAFLMGLYLGFCLDYGGERNLLTPMVVHGLYDFVAFLVIIRHYRQLTAKTL
ncbi:MAG: CPBP family intramembrane metalloprotease [Methylomonas sp.]|nr:CPBP family intramembrane metalloprotease [Methylomonas sp.]